MSWFYKTIRKLRIPVPTTFVETGAYMGGGIESLLLSLRFQQIHSIELSPKWAEHCQKKFEAFPHIHVHEGDSATVLQRMIENNELPNEPVIFYLDAHYSGGETAGEKVDNYIDPYTGIPVVSLYGKKRKPSAEDLADVDVLLLIYRMWAPVFILTSLPYRSSWMRHLNMVSR